MLERAAAGDFDVLVVRELDRLSRHLVKQLTVEAELKQHGVAVAYALQDYAPTPEGDLMRHIRGAIAQYERELIKARTMRARRRIVRSGEVLAHARPPLGYVEAVEDGARTLAPDPETAPIVVEMFRRYAGGDSMRSIARGLTALGVPTCSDRYGATRERRGPAVWAPASIGDILSNETYAGRWRYAMTEDDGSALPPIEVPALVDEETWRALQERRGRNRKGSPRTKRPYLMAGRLTCGECGYCMVAHTKHSGGREYLYYVCPCAVRMGEYMRDCGAGIGRHATDVDATIWVWIRSLLMDPQALREALAGQEAERERRAASLRERAAERERMLEGHDRAMRRLLDRHLDGTLGVEEFRRTRAEREARAVTWRADLEALRADLAALEAEAPDVEATFVQDVAEGLAEAEDDFAERKRVIKLLDVRAVVHAGEGSATLLDVQCVIGGEALSVGSKGC